MKKLFDNFIGFIDYIIGTVAITIGYYIVKILDYIWDFFDNEKKDYEP